jgi:hypothetical protein
MSDLEKLLEKIEAIGERLSSMDIKIVMTIKDKGLYGFYPKSFYPSGIDEPYRESGGDKGNPYLEKSEYWDTLIDYFATISEYRELKGLFSNETEQSVI